MKSMISAHQVCQDVYRYRRTYLLAAVASFGGMLFGWDTGLIGGVLTMTAFQNSFDLHKGSSDYANTQGNIVSVLQAGCFFGAFASFFLGSTLGRKPTLILAAVIFLIGSTMQTCSGINTTSLGLLYGGRVVGGFGVGIVSAVVPIYIGENANKEIRGRVIGMMQLFNVTGIMLSFFVNYGVNKNIVNGGSKTWRIPFGLQMIPGVVLLVGLLFQNESPRWLVEKQRLDEARKALAHVRALPLEHEDVDFELQEIMKDFEGHQQLNIGQQARAVFASRSVYYPVIMALMLQFWQQWSGTNSINYYAPQIFQSIGLGSTNAGLFATGIYGVVKVIATTASLAFAVEQLGRKWCLIIGGLGQCFAMFYIGIHNAVSPSGGSLDGAAYFGIVCVYLFVVFYSLAWGHIPYILSSECSPNHVRSLVLAVALMMQWLWNFVIAKITPIMLARITYGTYLVFGCACFLAAVYALVFVPETKGVPLESVNLLFEGSIVRNALFDTRPKYQRAKPLKTTYLADRPLSKESPSQGSGSSEGPDSKAGIASHIEIA